MLAAQSRQKSYAAAKRKNIEFQVGEFVFLRVSPIRGVKRFGANGKLRPQFIGPFEVLDRVGAVAYKIAMLPSLSLVHDVTPRLLCYVGFCAVDVPDGHLYMYIDLMC